MFIKQIIQISDSEQIVKIQPEQPKKITLIQEKTNLKWQIDYRLRQFSTYLQNMQEENDQQDGSILTARVSHHLLINSQILELITVFYRDHNFSNQSIKINSISTEGYEKAIDMISRKYLQKYLKPQNQNSLKNLFNLCEFLKFNRLKQLISVYLASKHFFNFNQMIMKKQLEEKGAFFSRQQQINLKARMKKYAQNLSVELLERLKNKYDEQNRK